jgi:antitoxin (DNA-binding transcriptional repressor) of toxin-antitoxin stability system
MRELSVREMRQGYQVLKEALEQDGEVVLTHHGKPFAKVVPLTPVKGMPSHADLRARMPYQEVPSEVYIREDRDAR